MPDFRSRLTASKPASGVGNWRKLPPSVAVVDDAVAPRSANALSDVGVTLMFPGLLLRCAGLPAGVPELLRKLRIWSGGYWLLRASSIFCFRAGSVELR